MDTAVVNIKIEPQVKREAQKLAERLGLSLSVLIKSYLKQIIRAQEVVLTVSEEPTEYLLQALRASKADIKAGRVSPAFDNASDAIKWLNSGSKKYARTIRRKVSKAI